jgi:hypothetical protein
MARVRNPLPNSIAEKVDQQIATNDHLAEALADIRRDVDAKIEKKLPPFRRADESLTPEEE